MKRMMMTAIVALAGASLPMMASAMGADADGNGVLTMEEVKAIYPEITESVFGELDVDDDGVLSEAEYQAAVSAGILPPTEG